MVAMMSDDDEVAGLYRARLGEFIAARNALAKKRGAAGADIRRLEKPHAAAWAVNQLFWQRRAAYDAVADAARAMRDAHARMLSGRDADVAQAEGAHHKAIKAAIGAIGELARAGGESLSAATLDAVSETLQALPSNEPPGQLSRPLKPLGFGALVALGLQRPGVQPRVSGVGGGPKVEKSRDPAVLAVERAAAKKEVARHAARRKALQEALRAAQARELEAENALAASREALAKAERDHAVARDRVLFLEKHRADAEQDTHQRARALQAAANSRLQAEQAASDRPQ